jgi:hypothetical protein
LLFFGSPWPRPGGVEGYSSGIEEVFAELRHNNVGGHGVADTGDEVENVLVAIEEGHGLAEGVPGVYESDRRAIVLNRGSVKDTFPGLLAADDGWVLKGSAEGDFSDIGRGWMDHGVKSFGWLVF